MGQNLVILSNWGAKLKVPNPFNNEFMITAEQQQWLSHLSDKDKVTIIPFDPTSQEKFEKINSIIKNKLGALVRVEHRGASGLGISGQDEIDIYIPVPSNHFDQLVVSLTDLFGEPISHYALKRARFVATEVGKHIDIFAINEESADWLNSVTFENYLRTHPETLEEYRQLKENGDGLSVREYYFRKIEFINKIISKHA